MNSDSNFVLKIAAKPLQIVTWLLLTAYRNSSSLYPTILSPTFYDVPFSHNTYVIDVQTDARTNDSLCYKHDRYYGRPIT